MKKLFAVFAVFVLGILFSCHSESLDGNPLVMEDGRPLPSLYSSSSSGGGSSSSLRSSSSDEVADYCYGYGSYRDCNLVGGTWITDAQQCLSGGGILVTAAYCDENSIYVDNTTSPLYDSRDGKTYNTIRIGDQTWMAENLNYDTGTDGKCYDNQNDYCDKYGRLYNWATAMMFVDIVDCGYNWCNWGDGRCWKIILDQGTCQDAIANCQANGSPCYNPTEYTTGICPDGWHIPNDVEWNILFAAVGGSETAGRYLKSASGWDSDEVVANGNGENTYGFSALPGGSCNGGTCSSVGYSGCWWTAEGYFWGMNHSIDAAGDNKADNKTALHSVRCVKD